jgi:surfeit locus 1 family protein
MQPIRYKDRFYAFKPTLLGCMITLICILVFIKLGLWQYNKAQQKLAIQSAYQEAEGDKPKAFPVAMLHALPEKVDEWKYKRVEVLGEYQTQYQFLLDNQVEGTQAGYHVITPLRIDGSDQTVLINRGWIPAKRSHADVPDVATPRGQCNVTGQLWRPSKKFFTLESTETLASKEFQVVWQNIDLDRYQKLVLMQVSPLMIKLDSSSTCGGFVRNWQIPTERISTHIGYAYQWFGFAIASLLIFIYMSMQEMGSKKKVV